MAVHRMMRMMLVAGFMFLHGTVPIEAATIHLDFTKRFQTIDGFGGYGASVFENWQGSDEFIGTLIDDLGLTIQRADLPYDNSASAQAAYFARIQARAKAKGEPVKFIASCWSPPAYMKTNNNVAGGGNLKPDQYRAFADHVVNYVRTIKAQGGIDLYAVSIQNEPAFVEPYKSCVYTAETYRDVAKVVGKALRDAGYQTILFGPEDVNDIGRTGRFFVTSQLDPEASKYLKVLAVHGYGANGISSSTNASWSRLHQMASTYKCPLWMTETSGYSSTTWEDGPVTHWDGSQGYVPGGLGLATSILVALRDGNLGGWVWWTLSDNKNAPSCLIFNGSKSRLYYASKHFYRYLRPGAIRVDAVCDNSAIGVVAFVHPVQFTLTIVCINTASSQQTISLTGSTLPKQFTGYVSDNSNNCLQRPSLAASDIPLPARSVMTLVAENYSAPTSTGTVPRLRVASPEGYSPKPVSKPILFSLDGRSVSRHRMVLNIPGAFLQKGHTIMVQRDQQQAGSAGNDDR